jgi:hypothetical protein
MAVDGRSSKSSGIGNFPAEKGPLKFAVLVIKIIKHLCALETVVVGGAALRRHGVSAGHR